MCIHSKERIPKQTVCPRGYLDFTNLSLSFDPKKEECSETYTQTKMRILQDCRNRNDSQNCLIDLPTDTSSFQSCFQVHELRILHTCEGEQKVMTNGILSITKKNYPGIDRLKYCKYNFYG